MKVLRQLKTKLIFASPGFFPRPFFLLNGNHDYTWDLLC